MTTGQVGATIRARPLRCGNAAQFEYMMPFRNYQTVHDFGRPLKYSMDINGLQPGAVYRHTLRI